MKLVKIIWEDISSSDEWQDKSEIKNWVKKDRKDPVETVGYIFEECRNDIILVNHKSKRNYGYSCRIPRRSIIKICPLPQEKNM